MPGKSPVSCLVDVLPLPLLGWCFWDTPYALFVVWVFRGCSHNKTSVCGVRL